MEMTHRTGSRRRVGALITLTTAAVAAVSGVVYADDPADLTYHYRHLKDVVEVTLDPGAVFVLASEGVGDDALLHTLDARGMNAADVRLSEMPGWAEARMVGVADAASTERLVADLTTAMDLAFVSPVFFDEYGGPTTIRPEVFVGFTPETGPMQAVAILEAHGLGEIIEVAWRGEPNVYHVRASSRNGFEVLAAANALADRADVAFAEPDRIFTMYPAGDGVFPNDPGFPLLWGLHNTGQDVDGWTAFPDRDVNAPQAWEHESGTPGIIVAVLDNGIQQNHPDINQVTPGIDTTTFNGNGGPLFEYDNHGTAVAGCITAIMNNGIGTVGVAPNCRTISAKIAYDNSPTPGWTSAGSWVANGIYDSVAAGARITNSSFHMGPTSVATIAYNATYSAGIMHFAATGNDGESTIDYPSNLGVTNAISALAPNGFITSFSNYGTGTHFIAPGTALWTTDRTGSAGYASGSYTFFSGTSGAAPYAAGVAALAMSANPTLNAVTCGSTMAATARDLGPGGYDTQYGFGLPDAHGAVILALYGDDCPGSGSCVQSNGSPGCDDGGCCFAICDLDSFCCDVQWDGLCADQAAALCYGCGSSSSGDCGQSNGSPGCEDADCCAAVCADDPFCCEVSWDALCASNAASICTPSNDLCGEALWIIEGTYPVSTVGASAELVSPISCGEMGPDVYYKIVAPCSGTMSVSTCGSTNFDTKIAVYRESVLGLTCPGGSLFSAVFLACNDDAPGCGDGSYVTVDVTAGTIYTIRIGGSDTGSGTFEVNCFVPNNICGFASAIFEGDTEFSTIGATTDGPAHPSCDFCCDDDQIHNDIWYVFNATCTGTLTVSTCGLADYDTKMAVYKPASEIGYVCQFGDPMTLLGCNDDTPGCSGFTSEVSIPCEAGVNYRIRIGGFDGASGSGIVNVECATSTCPGDINGDDTIGSADLAMLLSAWGDCAGCVEDLNGDNVVDAADLAVMLSGWGGCDG